MSKNWSARKVDGEFRIYDPNGIISATLKDGKTAAESVALLMGQLEKTKRACAAMDAALSKYGSAISDMFGNDTEFLRARELIRNAR